MTSNNSSKVRDITFLGVLIAIVAISTRLGFNFTGTPGGYSHLGNIPLIAIAILLGKRKGALVGGLGMFLFDMVSEYFAWAPFTLIIRAAMGYVIGSFAFMNGKQGNSLMLNIMGILFASAIMLGGYYIAEGVIYGNWAVPMQSIPGNLLQLAVGIGGGIPLAMTLKNNKTIKKYIN